MLDAALMSDSPPALADSFEQVVRQWETQVLRTSYRILGNWADAEDVAQEAFSGFIGTESASRAMLPYEVGFTGSQ